MRSYISTNGPKQPFALRERRQDDELGPELEKRVFRTKLLDRPEGHIRPAGEIRGLGHSIDGRAARAPVDARRHNSIS